MASFFRKMNNDIVSNFVVSEFKPVLIPLLRELDKLVNDRVESVIFSLFESVVTTVGSQLLELNQM